MRRNSLHLQQVGAGSTVSYAELAYLSRPPPFFLISVWAFVWMQFCARVSDGLMQLSLLLPAMNRWTSCVQIAEPHLAAS